jgi:hypothetical protein
MDECKPLPSSDEKHRFSDTNSSSWRWKPAMRSPGSSFSGVAQGLTLFHCYID